MNRTAHQYISIWGWLCLVFVAVVSVSAQDSTPLHASIGAAAYGRLNIHAASFASLPDVPCCSPGFTGSSDLGFAAGMVYNHPIGTSWLVSGRLNYIGLNTAMTTDEPRTVHLFGQAVPGLFRHTLQATMSAVSIDALVGYQPVDRLTLLAGPSVSTILSATYVQTEEIIEPAIGGFDVTGQQRIRTLGTGVLPGVSAVSIGATVGASYSLVVDERRGITVAPELSATMGLQSIVGFGDAAASWKLHALRAGVVVSYAFGHRFLDQGAMEDDDFKGLEASLVATALRHDGRESPLTSIRLEQSVTTNSKPLLPVIFFDEKRVVLPQRYVQRTPATTQEFSEQQFHDTPVLATYYDILNIIGRRMQSRPTATVSVTGVVPSDGIERGRRDLGAGRAYAVKDYLVTTWKISASRIKAGFRDVDVDSSRLTDKTYIDELRRVELESSDDELLADVWTTDTTWTSEPAAVRLAPIIRSSEDITKWKLRLLQDTVEQHVWQGEDEEPASIDWTITGLLPVERWQTGMVRASLSVTNDDDASVDVETTDIPITVLSLASKREQGQRGTRVDRHTFIGFALADASPTAAHKRIAERLRMTAAQSTSVRVDGYTDASGDAAYNRTLSQQRASNIAALLGNANAAAVGHGILLQRYDQTLPEGRFYARSVEVEITGVQ